MFLRKTRVEPVSKAVTLFDATAVYHFVDRSGKQVIIYRSGNANREGQFIILDENNKQRTNISTKRIKALMEKLTKWAAEQDDVLLKFSAQPIFEETYDEESGTLTLEQPGLELYGRYRCLPRTKQALGQVSRVYRLVFASELPCCTARRHPGARLELNKSTNVEHGVLPVEIRRTMEKQDIPLRATHFFSWRLSRDDRQRIDATQRRAGQFQKGRQRHVHRQPEGRHSGAWAVKVAFELGFHQSPIQEPIACLKLRPRKLVEPLLEFERHRARFAGAEGAAVDFHHGNNFRCRAGEEAFVGDVDVVFGERHFGDFDAVFAGQDQ